VLVALYAVFALAAGARAGVQLATRFDEAPLAYLLSALAAAVYLVATVALARGPAGRRVALAAISVELVGVLVVGTLSLADAAAFPDETVWSGYGRGYLYIPLVLPVLGLLLLRRSRRAGGPTGH
jgi:NhaP-type Na+/H+ and K+/H+ antiporter